MLPETTRSASLRVLCLAPVGRDGRLVQKILGGAGIEVLLVANAAALCEAIDQGAGAAILTEEALTLSSQAALLGALQRQPPWSDLPLVVCTEAGAITHESRGRMGAIMSRGSVTLVERPTRVQTLVSVVRAALQARGRQYELCDLIEQRERLLQAAETANHLKDEFLATVSHELRTPLMAILGWSQMLQSDKLNEERRRHALQTIERNAKAQSQLVEDLLDVSRIVSGKLRLDVTTLRPARIVEAALDAVRMTAELKGVRLESYLDPTAGPVRGDASRLQQVVWNLLVNAVKFTPAGGRVVVALNRVDGHSELVVSDNGRGVSADFLPYLFDRFRQADGSSTRAQGGLGLGLSIVKHLVELHAGVITVDSEGEGLGATFTLRLPDVGAPADTEREVRRRATTPSDGTLVYPPQIENVRVLLVEDEADTREMLVVLLESCRVRVTPASSAAEALESFAKDPPDVLISDIGMPGGDGYELMRTVRAMPPERGGGVPALALTAYARAEDRVKALAAGFNDHLAKPMQPRALVQAIAALIA